MLPENDPTFEYENYQCECGGEIRVTNLESYGDEEVWECLSCDFRVETNKREKKK